MNIKFQEWLSEQKYSFWTGRTINEGTIHDWIVLTELNKRLHNHNINWDKVILHSRWSYDAYLNKI